jgi:quercetin dioxygenase-like cupin family protein
LSSRVTVSRPGEAAELSASIVFDGPVHTSPLGTIEGPQQCKAAYVRFERGSHTQLHVHDSDQILIVVSGSGHVGAVGDDHRVVPGDIVHIPAGVPHYHGASMSDAMAHVALLAGTTTVTEKLSWPPQN